MKTAAFGIPYVVWCLLFCPEHSGRMKLIWTYTKGGVQTRDVLRFKYIRALTYSVWKTKKSLKVTGSTGESGQVISQAPALCALDSLTVLSCQGNKHL